MPILIFGREFWGKALNLDHLVEQGMINVSDLKLFQFVDDAQEAWELIRASLQE
jgi:predicted Rossmann-fold nucleotide-binding protein